MQSKYWLWLGVLLLGGFTAHGQAPQKPEPIARRKAMNARPVAMGWRIMTRVRALEVSIEAVVKVVWSMPSMMTAGL